MTVLFSIATWHSIIVTVDSAVTNEYEDGSREYIQGTKAYGFPGCGLVTTWGHRVGNNIDRFLEKELAQKEQTVADLIWLTDYYLRAEYEPSADGLIDVGYHVVGFDNGKPCLHHIFYGYD